MGNFKLGTSAPVPTSRLAEELQHCEDKGRECQSKLAPVGGGDGDSGGDGDGDGDGERVRFTWCLCATLFVQLGYFYGMSPLVLPVATHFGVEDDVLGGLFLFGTGIMFLMLDLVGFVCSLHLPRTPRAYRGAVLGAMAAWTAALLLQALAVAQRLTWLFLLSFVGLGAGLGVLGLFFLHVVLTGWWSHDVPRAHAIAGFAIGAGAIGETNAYVGAK